MPEAKTIIVGMCEIERKTHLDSIKKLEEYVKGLEQSLLDIHKALHTEDYDMINEIYFSSHHVLIYSRYLPSTLYIS